MTVARKHQIHLQTTPYYHCISRCVRQAYLCGKDLHSGKNYEHRRQWIEDKVKQLSSVFAIDICAYAIMSNHYHLVLRVDDAKTYDWSTDDIIERWCTVYSGYLLVQQNRNGDLLSSAQRQAVSAIVELWRTRLRDISWFMRCLNEAIARQANQEDNCRGRFWQGRFKSQALLDETALLTCMVYVDLNPIRAGMCKTPESSEYTSIRERLLHYKRTHNTKNKSTATKAPHGIKTTLEGQQSIAPASLLPFIGSQNQQSHSVPGIEFGQTDYFELVDWTGRHVRKDKPGAMPANIVSILERLQIDENEWVNTVGHFGRRFYRFVGPVDLIRSISKTINRKWLKGMFQCERLYKKCNPILR